MKQRNVDTRNYGKNHPRFAEGGDVGDDYNTKLSPSDESKFQDWKAKNAPADTGTDYDLRGAYKGGAEQAENGHWPDTYKKPNHPTFSDESQYANTPVTKGMAGHWEGDTFVPPVAGGSPE